MCILKNFTLTWQLKSYTFKELKSVLFLGIYAYIRSTEIRGHQFPVRLGFIWQSTNLTPWIYLIIYITVRRTSSIIPCRNASCYILPIYFNGSEIFTCLIKYQINDERKMPTLNEETLLESGKLFKKNCPSRSLDLP